MSAILRYCFCYDPIGICFVNLDALHKTKGMPIKNNPEKRVCQVILLVTPEQKIVYQIATMKR